jgi:hypothetical protein
MNRIVGLLSLCILLSGSGSPAIAQPVDPLPHPPSGGGSTPAAPEPEVPEEPAVAPITPGPHTILLDHFDGSTTGTAVGYLGYMPSRDGFGQAGRFGTGNFVLYTIGSMSQGTIEMWVKPDDVPSDTRPGLLDINWYATDYYAESGHILHLGLTGESGGQLRVSAWPEGFVTGHTGFDSSGEWVHLAASWGPAGTRLYVNGVLDCIAPALDVSFLSSNYVYLNYWGDQRFSGLIDELHVSDIQLTDQEIASHAIPE